MSDTTDGADATIVHVPDAAYLSKHERKKIK